MTFTVHPWVLGYIRHLRTLRNIERWVHQSISEEYSLHPLCNISSQPLWVSKDRFQSRYTSLTARAHSMEEEPLTEKKQVFVSLNKNLASTIKPKSVLEKFPRATGLGGVQADIMPGGDLTLSGLRERFWKRLEEKTKRTWMLLWGARQYFLPFKFRYPKREGFSPLQSRGPRGKSGRSDSLYLLGLQNHCKWWL